MKRGLLIAVIVLLFLGFTFFTQIHLGALSALLLWDLLDEETVRAPDRGALAWVTASPKVERLEISGAKDKIAADLYLPQGQRKRTAILLTHGIIEHGKDDPRLIRFARSLARSGFVVLIPELKGMKSFRVIFSDVDDIVASFRAMSSLEIVDGEKMGLMGFSYGAGPTFLAAAHPAIASKVKFLASFGGYYDPVNVIRFITTGYYEYGEEKGFGNPEPYGKWVFFMNNLHYVESPRDRRLLKRIFDTERKKEKEDVGFLLRDLTSEGRSLYELLTNEDPRRVEELIGRIDPRVRDYLNRLSLAPVIPAVQAYLLIGHGSTDPLIPYTESLRLAAAAPDKGKVHVAVIRLFTHVDPARPSASAKDFFTVYLPSVVEFYYLIYDLLSQQLSCRICLFGMD